MAATKKRAAKKAAPAKKSKKVGKSAPAKKKYAGKKSVAAPKKAPAAARKSAAPSGKSQPAAKQKARRNVLDFEGFPAGSVTHHSTSLCLACVFGLFTQQFGLAPRTAYAEVRRYAPTLAELTAREPQRPFFKTGGEKNPRCPYCDAAGRWHARVDTYRIEGGKSSDTARRAFVKSLPTRDEQFQIQEVRSDARTVFFEWLEALGQELDFEDESGWMLKAARSYLERREPKAAWVEAFEGVRQVRRSQRVEEGFEREGARLFLAPALYDEVLLVQYLVSRSHRHGGRTFEGRLTLHELVRRMRRGGRLDARGINDRDQFDVLEKLVEELSGGERPLKLHYIVDRRDLLDKVKTIYARYA